MTGSCIIYRTEKFFKIVTEAESDIGLTIHSDPIYLIDISCSLEELSDLIFSSLANYKENVPTPKRDEWKDWQNNLLLKLKEKSFNSLYKNSVSCSLKLNNSKIKIILNKFIPKEGLTAIEDSTFILDYKAGNELEITKHVYKLLNEKFTDKKENKI